MSSSCLVVKGSLDLLGFGLGCASAGLTGSRVVAGTFTANAGGTYVDRTTTSGEEIIELPEACLSVAGTLVTCERLGPALQSLGYDSVTCEPDGGGCRCSALFEQSGGMGVLSLDPSTGGTYEAAGSVVTLHSQTDAPKDYRYCVTEDQLTILPQTTPTDALRGTLVLARE